MSPALTAPLATLPLPVDASVGERLVRARKLLALEQARVEWHTTKLEQAVARAGQLELDVERLEEMYGR